LQALFKAGNRKVGGFHNGAQEPFTGLVVDTTLARLAKGSGWPEIVDLVDLPHPQTHRLTTAAGAQQKITELLLPGSHYPSDFIAQSTSVAIQPTPGCDPAQFI
jgi:hypothetical protein